MGDLASQEGLCSMELVTYGERNYGKWYGSNYHGTFMQIKLYNLLWHTVTHS